LVRRLRYTKEKFSDLEGEVRTIDYWMNHLAWREHRRELLREARERQLERQLEREARKASKALAHSKKGVEADEAKVAELLELNDMPRWVAFEERFIVADKDGELLAAVRYQTEPKQLVLGLLVADPWAGERRLAVALYAGARRLALELGASDILARTDGCHASYPYEAGYHRWGCGWRMDMLRPVERREKLPQ
jgi:hypothetical protein